MVRELPISDSQADLANMYDRRVKQFNVDSKPIHRTRLKEMLMKKVPDLQAYTKGRNVLLVSVRQ